MYVKYFNRVLRRRIIRQIFLYCRYRAFFNPFSKHIARDIIPFLSISRLHYAYAEIVEPLKAMLFRKIMHRYKTRMPRVITIGSRTSRFYLVRIHHRNVSQLSFSRCV